MRIVVCYKCVPSDQEIIVKSDRTLSFDNAQPVISRYDLEALEAAVRLKSEDDEIFALTVADGAVDNSKLRKAVLSRGPQELYSVHDAEASVSDSLRTAEILKAAIEHIGDVDLVLCGEGSEDMYCQQVGPVLGVLLGWNTVNSVSSVAHSDSGIRIERSLESSTEILEIPLPAVISMSAGALVPKVPSMKEILAAGKKPFTKLEAAELTSADNTAETVSLLAPAMAERRCEIVDGSGEEDIEAFYQLLRRSL